MKIKDFVPGQQVAVITTLSSNKKHLSVLEVKSVGRKYVKVGEGEYTRPYGYCLRNEKDEYLTEAKDWGHPELLFPSVKTAEEYLERKELVTHIVNEFRQFLFAEEKYSLDQLRRIKKIMEEER